MERVIGLSLGMIAGVAAVLLGLGSGLPALEVFWRAALSGIGGFLAGWLVFGKMGVRVVREAAGRPAEPERTVPLAGRRPPSGT